MQLRPEIQLQSMIKAMKDTIIPVLAPDNKPAREQAQLIVETMRLMQKQLPIMYDFDRDELSRLVALAESLQAEADDEEGLNGVVRSAKHALAGASTTPKVLEQEIKRLRKLIGECVTRTYQSADPAKKGSSRVSVKK
ncbi:hypothetical protein EHM94_17955 [Marinobacter sp. NP-6]|uniref:hypothetical protein n=1 Tax=Marinobacter sp. NP-6 TaxID=2488666 RepID=UPI000FCB9B5C|nr:hypothetical protein [Marinobacter sp. NP-6]RUT76917.1 hypothetical protein EHM94_17955 [Marinobacter sp. NP-6]